MRRAAAFVIALFLTVLPSRYRRWWPQSEEDLVPAALVSGTIQMSGAFVVFLLSYLEFFQQRVGDLGMQVLNAPPSRVTGQALGAVATAEFVLRPTTWLLVYLTVEGAVRLLAALSVREVAGTLPLHVASLLQDWIEPRLAERKLGPPVPDRVQEVAGKSYDLLVGASRKKPGWDAHITIRYREELYEVMKEADGRPPYRFLYELRKNPAWRVTRRIEDYDPAQTAEASES